MIRTIFRAAVIAAAAILLLQSVRVVGIDPIVDGLARVGWGFAAILLLSGAREVVRTIAWTRTVEGPAPLRFLPALGARLGGEALNTLLPMGMVIGEPAKASHVAPHIPFATAFKALVVEFAFYTASLVLLFAAGLAAFGRSNTIPLGPYPMAFAAAIAVTAFALLAAARWGRPLRDATFGFAARHPRRAAIVVACEIAYHVLGVVEVYVSLWLISPVRPTVAAAIVLEMVNRVVTMVFKMIPMRVGVDEVGSSVFAARVDLNPATGVTLALIRKVRLLFWSAIGLALLVRRPTRRAPAAAAPQPAIVGLALLLTLGAAGAARAQQPTSTVAGTVSIAGPDGQPLVVPGVTLTLTCVADDPPSNPAPRVEISNENGDFQFADVPAGSTACSVVADLQGFKSETRAVALKPGETTMVTLRLGFDTLREEVTVSAKSDTGADDARALVPRMTAQVMQSAPLASERFQAALPLIPGVVRGPDGLLNINGSRSNQSALTFNSANGTDPVTGEDAIELPIDAVSSVQVRGAAYAPEYGLSAGAVTTVDTQRAGDAWHVTLNDLEPRLRRRGGRFKGIESFTPRVTIGGPIVKGRLNLLHSSQYELSQTRVFGLPPFESDTKLQSLASFTRADWTIAPSNRVTASAMISPRKTTYAGLNTFNPQPVTANIRNDSFLGSVSDQLIVGAKGVFDTRVSVKQFDATIYPSVGSGGMVLAPDVNAGSYFNHQDRSSRRAEWLSTYSFTPIGPEHVIKLGTAFTHEWFDGVSRSDPVRVVRADGTLSQLTEFAGDGELARAKTAVYGYVQDFWSVAPRLTVQYGARYDYDSIAGDMNVAPRASFTAVATADGRTVVRGGLGLFYSPIPLNVATVEQLQRRVVTAFGGDGVTPLEPSVELPNTVRSPLRMPRSVNATIEVDREWIRNFFVRVGYQQREQRFEPVVDAEPAAIVLRVDGRSHYREGQISARYQFHGTDQIVGSYTRSSAIGNLNDFNGFFGNIENPIIRPDARGPLPWDAPNRVLLWSSVSLPRGFSIFPVLDVRTGFPYSNVDADRNFVGPRNEAGRYPRFVSLDAQIAKKLRLFNHNATIGLKVFNITDHFNPRDYQGNLASRYFGRFDNSVGRTFRGKWIFEF